MKPDPLILWGWDAENIDLFFRHSHAVMEAPILAGDPHDSEELKFFILEYLSAEATFSGVADEDGILGINCKDDKCVGQLCSAIRALSDSPWAVAVLDAAGAGAGPIAKVYVVEKSGKLVRLFDEHAPGRLFE